MIFWFMFFPVSYAAPPSERTPLSLIGLVLFYGGLLVEALADAQKSQWKRVQPNLYISTGLYRFCRHPNYAGELVMYWGSFLASPMPWTWTTLVPSALGLVAIHMIIVVAGMKRLEAKQAGAYGARPDYQKYIQRTAKLIPFIW